MRGIKRTSGFAPTATLLVLLAAGVWLAGCSEQPTMLLIRGAAVAESDCSLSADPAAFLSQGVIDVSLASGYTLSPNVENVAASSKSVGAQTQQQQTQQSSVFGDLTVEGNRILITSADVDFEFMSDLPSAASEVFRGFELPIGGAVIDPEGGKATVPISVLNSYHVETLRQVIQQDQYAMLIVTLRLRGVTSSDTEVESNEFQFPITACNGCLVATDCATEGEAAQDRCVIPGQDVIFCPESAEPVEDTTEEGS